MDSDAVELQKVSLVLEEGEEISELIEEVGVQEAGDDGDLNILR